MLNGLPDLMYNFSPNQLDAKFILAKNIWKRGEILNEFKTSISLFDEYIVKNGERPEDISTQLYKNPFYNWTILIINDITDYYSQWPRSDRQIQEFVNNKYSQPMGTKYYVTTEVTDDDGNIICPAGKIVPQTFQVAYYNGSTTVTANPTVSVSNYQYEEQLNAKKEKIQVVRPTVIEEFVNVYYQLLTKGAPGIVQVGGTLSDISM